MTKKIVPPHLLSGIAEAGEFFMKKEKTAKTIPTITKIIPNANSVFEFIQMNISQQTRIIKIIFIK